MESYSQRDVFMSVNEQLSIDELNNKIALLKVKLAKLESDTNPPDLMASNDDFLDSVNSLEEQAKIQKEIDVLYQILAKKQNMKKAA